MASECSGIRSGCGCERARAAGSGSLHRPTRLAVSSIGCLDKVLRRARSPHQRGATPQGRSPGASASRRAGNLETWDPAARSRTPGFPGFQIFSSSPRRRPRRARPGGGGARGRAATWRTGKLERWESARRGARRVDAGPPLPGVPAWGALGRRPWPPPWPGGARPSRAQGCDFRGSPRRCSRKRPPYRVGAVPQERVQSTEHTRSPRRTPENRRRARADSYSVVE